MDISGSCKAVKVKIAVSLYRLRSKESRGIKQERLTEMWRSTIEGEENMMRTWDGNRRGNMEVRDAMGPAQ